MALRMPDKERYVRKLGPERPVRLPRVAVLAEGYTVIGQNEQQGVVHAARGFHLVEEAAEPAVDHRYLSRVQRLHPLQFLVVDPVRGAVVGYGGIPTLVAFAVGLDVLLGRIPRLVWVEAVYNQKEGLSIFGLLQKVHPSGEDPRGEPVLLGLAVPRVGEVLAYLVHHVGVVPRDCPLPYLLLGNAQFGAEAVPLLATDPLEHPEPALEIHGGVKHGLGIGEHRCAVAGRKQGLRECRLLLRDRLPACRLEGLSRQPDDVSEGPGPHAGVDRPAGAEGRQRLRVSPTKAQALLRQRIQVGGLYTVVTVDPDVIFPEAVQNHQYDVHCSYPLMAR